MTGIAWDHHQCIRVGGRFCTARGPPGRVRVRVRVRLGLGLGSGLGLRVRVRVRVRVKG